MEARAIFILVAIALGSGPAMAQSNAWQQRYRRDQAVACYGVGVRPLVERYGDDAVYALAACSYTMAPQLGAFYSSGQLDRRPRPEGLLRAIANGGDVVAWYVMQNGELTDIDKCDAFIAAPLDYALNVRSLDAGAAEVRAARLRGQSWWPPDTRLAGGVGVVVIIGLVIWWRRRRGM